ncbi:preprotein translocase subunit SecY [Lachnospiraceae bacterium PF1-22]
MSIKKKELIQKISLTFGVLAIIVILSNIPMLFIKREVLSQMTDGLSFLTSLMSGNAFSQMSFLALGVSPYITSSIILQLMHVFSPKLHELSRGGKTERDQYEKIQYIVAGILGLISSIAMAISLSRKGAYESKFIALATISFLIGSAFMICASKLIDKKGLGSGMSLVIMVNILTSMPATFTTIYSVYINGKTPAKAGLAILIVFTLIILLFGMCILLLTGESNVPVQYSGKVVGRRMMQGGQSSIPLKLNISGVVPVIFASSILQIIAVILDFFQKNEVMKYFSMQYWFTEIKYVVGFLLYALLIILFSFFYNTFQFDPIEVANDLKTGGGMIHGIRPGQPTEQYLRKKVRRLTIIGSIGLCAIAATPIIIGTVTKLGMLSFGGTSLLIVIGVIIDLRQKIMVDIKEVKTRENLFMKRRGALLWSKS